MKPLGVAKVAAIFILAALFPTGQSAKILLMPFNHKSHVNIFTSMGIALAKEGHEAAILTIPKFEKSVKKHQSLNSIIAPITKDADFNLAMEAIYEKNPGVTITSEILQTMVPYFENYCDQILSNEGVMEAIRKEKFDLAIVDGLVCGICMYMIPYKFDIPYITMHGFQVTSWVAGVTGMPSIEPEVETLYSNQMDFWQRLHNLKAWLEMYDNPFSHFFSEGHMAKYAGRKPKTTYNEIIKNSEMFLVNFEIYCLDYPRVSAPNYQFLGATTATDPKPLTGEVAKFVEGAEHGIVVMTFGTMKAFHFAWITIGDKVFEALGRLDQKIIVQYSLDKQPKKVPANVMLMGYLPQNDLLGHPKTKLFITHGGNNGQNEATYHGVPSMVIPISADQPYAGERVRTHGYGDYIEDRNTATSDEFYQMMIKIINNDTYSKNIKKCSAIVRDMPPAGEKFVFWVNHILKFGGAHLRPPSMDMPLYKVLMLDIVAYYVVSYLMMFHVALFALYYMYCKCCRTSKTKKE